MRRHCSRCITQIADAGAWVDLVWLGAGCDTDWPTGIEQFSQVLAIIRKSNRPRAKVIMTRVAHTDFLISALLAEKENQAVQKLFSLMRYVGGSISNSE